MDHDRDSVFSTEQFAGPLLTRWKCVSQQHRWPEDIHAFTFHECVQFFMVKT